MILSRLSIVNFKNIAQADLEFSSGLNCFLGNNGMGKTNLLDALYYLSFCKSSMSLTRRISGTVRISLCYRVFIPMTMCARRFIAE